LEVRRCGDGHPPVTERERVIRLNGIGGVIFQNPDRNFDPGFFVGDSCHSEGSEESRTIFCPAAETNSQRCFASLNSPQDESAVAEMTRNAVSIYRTNEFENSCAP